MSKQNAYTKEEHQQVAAKMQRDSEGHFVHADPVQTSSTSPKQSNPISKFLSNHTDYNPKSDDLLNVHVGNPLKRITHLLEDLKKQKAFSFSIKGSLGLAGFAIAIGLLGIFGTNSILCTKGTQSEIGIIKQLQFKESNVSFLSSVPVLNSLFTIRDSSSSNRLILIKYNNSAIKINKLSSLKIPTYMLGERVIITGDYNACSQTISIKTTTQIEHAF